MRKAGKLGWAAVMVGLVAGCSPRTDDGTPAFLRSTEYRQYESADACFRRCATSFDHCQAMPHDLATCTQDAAPGKQSRCGQIEDPAKRNNCLAQALDCNVRGHVDQCSSARGQCLGACGN